MMSNSIKARRQLLHDQNGECAFCRHVFAAYETTYHHKQTDTIVCKQCSPLVVQLMASVDRLGGTEALFKCLAAFMAAVNAKTGEKHEPTLEELGRHVDEQGRIVDGDGNIYDDKGTVIGDIYNGDAYAV